VNYDNRTLRIEQQAVNWARAYNLTYVVIAGEHPDGLAFVVSSRCLGIPDAADRAARNVESFAWKVRELGAWPTCEWRKRLGLPVEDPTP